MLRWLITIQIALFLSACGADSKDNATVSSQAGKADSFRWKLVTTWPKNFPGLGIAPERLAKLVEQMSDGRLKIQVYGAGELVPAFGVFDAVQSGVAQMGHGAAYYWRGKIPEAVFFTSIPFGLTAQEMNAWLNYGGGLQLWRELYEPYDLYPVPAGNTGVQMAGWFNKKIKSVASLKGLKMRIPGLAGDVLTRAGGESVVLPGDEIFTSLQTGVIDATEWVGPYNDLAFGLHTIAEYYYYPGWHEPGSTMEAIINRQAFNTLPSDLQVILETAWRVTNQDMLDEFTAKNRLALKELVEVHGVQLLPLPDDVLVHLRQASQTVLAEIVEKSDKARTIYQSITDFQRDIANYHAISEQAYMRARELGQPPKLPE